MTFRYIQANSNKRPANLLLSGSSVTTFLLGCAQLVPGSRLTGKTLHVFLCREPTILLSRGRPQLPSKGSPLEAFAAVSICIIALLLQYLFFSKNKSMHVKLIKGNYIRQPSLSRAEGNYFFPTRLSK